MQADTFGYSCLLENFPERIATAYQAHNAIRKLQQEELIAQRAMFLALHANSECVDQYSVFTGSSGTELWLFRISYPKSRMS